MSVKACYSKPLGDVPERMWEQKLSKYLALMGHNPTYVHLWYLKAKETYEVFIGVLTKVGGVEVSRVVPMEAFIYMDDLDVVFKEVEKLISQATKEEEQRHETSSSNN